MASILHMSIKLRGFHLIGLMIIALSMGYVIRGWRHGFGYGYYRDDAQVRAIHPHANLPLRSPLGISTDGDHTESSKGSPSSSERSQLSYFSPHRWSVIPQGWYDDEEYDDNIDTATCTTVLRRDRHLRNQETISMLTRLGVNMTYEKTKGKAKPWWYSRLVEGSDCQYLMSMKQCHKTSLTCQWSLQGYCFNYSAPSIGNRNTHFYSYKSCILVM
jgi:hypothetical protein